MAARGVRRGGCRRVAAGCSSVASAAAGSNTTSPSHGPGRVDDAERRRGARHDSAGFFVAMGEGLFAKQGLTIKYTPAGSSETVIGAELRASLDISGGNYVSYIQAVAEHSDPPRGHRRGLGHAAGPAGHLHHAEVRHQDVRRTRGHVGVNAPENIDFLLDVSVLSENGVNMDSINSPRTNPVPRHVGEVAIGKHDAATLPEPFASIAQQQGDVTLADLDQGATQRVPDRGLRRHQGVGEATRTPEAVPRRAGTGPGDRRH